MKRLGTHPLQCVKESNGQLCLGNIVQEMDTLTGRAYLGEPVLGFAAYCDKCDTSYYVSLK